MLEMMQIRAATPEDCRIVFEWANDPVSRSASVLSDPIPWEAHEAWYAARMADPDSLLFLVANDDGTPIGIVRFEAEGGEAEISVNLAPDSRGGGTGTETIRRGCDAFFAARPNVPVIVAYIKQSNVMSQRAFVRAGFREADPREVRGRTMLRFERHP